MPDGMVGWLVVMCPEESNFLILFLQGRTWMRASGLVTEALAVCYREIQN